MPQAESATADASGPGRGMEGRAPPVPQPSLSQLVRDSYKQNFPLLVGKGGPRHRELRWAWKHCFDDICRGS